jgi:hypothetical protein
MADKKKPKKKTRSTTTTRGKMTRVRKMAKKKTPPRKSVKKKPGQKRAAAKRKVLGTTTAMKTRIARSKRAQNPNQAVDTNLIRPRGVRGALSGGQSGDLQGLSNRERADSESVDELLEEGNAFEADVVKGVEDAGNADESEVRTHEVPEDDVPDEYLDKE